MKHLIPLGIVLAIVLGCAPEADTGRVVGELASDRIELSAEFSEPLTALLVSEGESVVAGQPLLTLDDLRAKAHLAEAEAVYLQSKARMDELLRGPRREQITAARASLEGATQDLAFRTSELNRIQEIHQRGLASADSLDKAKAALDAERADLKLRQAQLQELLAGTTIEELAQAEQVVAQFAAARDRAEIDLIRHTLVAPVDGIVDSRLLEIGERPSVSQPAMIMLGGEQAYARVYVPEQLRVRISAGSAATIYVDGLATPLAGTVRWVSSEAAFTPYFALTERDRSRLSYVAKIDISDARGRLPDGIPVEVEFSLGRQ